MKILFDHGVPRPLRRELPSHEITTAREMRWEGLKDGKLLDAAAQTSPYTFVRATNCIALVYCFAWRRELQALQACAETALAYSVEQGFPRLIGNFTSFQGWAWAMLCRSMACAGARWRGCSTALGTQEEP